MKNNAQWWSCLQSETEKQEEQTSRKLRKTQVQDVTCKKILKNPKALKPTCSGNLTEAWHICHWNRKWHLENRELSTEKHAASGNQHGGALGCVSLFVLTVAVTQNGSEVHLCSDWLGIIKAVTTPHSQQHDPRASIYRTLGPVSRWYVRYAERENYVVFFIFCFTQRGVVTRVQLQCA